MFHAPHGYQRAPLPPAREQEPETPLARTATATPRSGAGAVTTPATPARAATPAPTPGATPAPKQRDAFFDNAKYLAIVFVAMAHMWEPVMDGSRATRALYIVVYSFHMPAFIIISGYFSRGFDMSRKKIQRLVTGVAVPYVIFETAYTLFKRWADDPDQSISLLDPWYLTWFLIALFVWRLTTPLWQSLRHPLPVALAIAVLASVTPNIGDDLNLQRVLQFLPYFVLGLLLKPEHFRMVRRREVRLLALPVVLATVVFAYWAAPRLDLGWFYHSSAAQQIGAPWWAGVVMTFALFGCSLVLTACFLAWVPGRTMWFTVLGAGTLGGYLLHGFLVKGAGYADLFETYPWLSTPPGEIFLTVAMAVVVTLLCTPLVRRLFRWAMEPEMNWAFRRDAVENARQRERRPAAKASA
ncbi:acyltransferase family protein [Streptomyces albidochromogenes]|uniref:Acyltransferase family protein n=1 Tax=Streptomyces albidochromogenes TaxID=329524 RepID=A0ABW6FU09_9ACTN